MHHEEQRAAAVMQRCLGRIGNTKYAQAWQQWVHANAAMVRAGCTMQQVLRRLSEEMDETVSIGVLDGGDVVYVARVEVRRIYAERLAVGARLPAACSAVGSPRTQQEQDGCVEEIREALEEIRAEAADLYLKAAHMQEPEYTAKTTKLWSTARPRRVS